MVRKRCDALVSEELKKANSTATPPTTLYIPKSSTPNFSSNTLDVKMDINIRTAIRTYKKSEFFAIRFELESTYIMLLSVTMI